jgi:hypothetical protein
MPIAVIPGRKKDELVRAARKRTRLGPYTRSKKKAVPIPKGKAYSPSRTPLQKKVNRQSGNDYSHEKQVKA